MIFAGQEAPNFTADSYEKGDFGKVSLSDYRGKWVVLYFYPGDFTFVWATEVSAVAERHAEYAKLGVQVLALSTDSIFVHKMWCEHELTKMTAKETIPFPMLSDKGGEIGKMYNVFNEDMGMNIRGTFIIDPDGVISAYEVLSPAVGRNLTENLRQIEAFQHVRESKSTEAMPVGWTSGDKVLTPGPKLVGKIWENWSPKK